MAVFLNLHDLSIPERESVVRDLEITPIVQSIQFDPKSGQRKMIKCPSSTPLQFYNASLSSGKLAIPFNYAQTKFNLHPDTSPAPKLNLSLVAEFEYRPHQLPIIEEATRHLNSDRNSTTLQINTSAGKTIMSIALAVEQGLKTLIVVPRKTLADQWAETILKITTPASPESKVLILPEAFKESKIDIGKRIEKISASDFVICLPERISGIPETLLESFFGTLIIDEAHLFCTRENSAALLKVAPRKVIALTATLDRDDEAHKIIRLIAGDHQFFKQSDRPYHIKVVKVPVMIEEVMSPVTQKLDFSSFKTSLSIDEKYNDAIVNVIRENASRKFIVITRSVQHIKEIQRKLDAAGEASVSVMYGNMKKCKDAKILIGTDSKIGTGFDVATFCEEFDGRSPDALIFAMTVKKWQTYAQIVGRIMRASPEVTPLVFWMRTENSITGRHLDALRGYIKKTEGVFS